VCVRLSLTLCIQALAKTPVREVRKPAIDDGEWKLVRGHTKQTETRDKRERARSFRFRPLADLRPQQLEADKAALAKAREDANRRAQLQQQTRVQMQPPPPQRQQQQQQQQHPPLQQQQRVTSAARAPSASRASPDKRTVSTARSAEADKRRDRVS
jgi:hypothetical protein